MLTDFSYNLHSKCKFYMIVNLQIQENMNI